MATLEARSSVSAADRHASVLAPPESYAEAVALHDRTTRVCERLGEDGHLRPGTDVAEAVDLWTLMVTGLVSQRLSNEPDVPLRAGRMTALVDPLVSTLVLRYGSRSKS